MDCVADLASIQRDRWNVAIPNARAGQDRERKRSFEAVRLAGNFRRS
jgi:hypothetical protein